MKTEKGRFSKYIRPFTHVVDLLIVNSLSFIFFIKNNNNSVFFLLIISIFWIIISFNIEFYEVYRYSKIRSIFVKIIKQLSLFISFFLAFMAVKEKSIDIYDVFKYTVYLGTSITIIKLSIFILLIEYRVLFGGNFRNVIIIGNGKKVRQLTDFFNKKSEYGYKLIHVFHTKEAKKTEINDYFSFIVKENIDEIYCTLSDLTNQEINNIIHFCDSQFKTVKFIPDDKEILSKDLKFDYYDEQIPILSLRQIPLDETTNKLIKRGFDILFSLFVIFFILSWLVPIITILIRIESKGSVIFKQKRNGLNYREFTCYKFRSMKINENINQAIFEDPRITKVGKFIRKTSIDELPQFFNVLIGNMSVVGPRPHVPSHNEMFIKKSKIDKFMSRHLIKPGITGLAQIKGYRGEIKTNQDIVFRVKYDIFYVENWSVLLDIKIIILTILNTLRGDRKAY